MNFAQLELKRDPEFRQFCENFLHRLRLLVPGIPISVEACLPVKLRGLLLASRLLEIYHSHHETPQWQRAKRAAGE